LTEGTTYKVHVANYNSGGEPKNTTFTVPVSVTGVTVTPETAELKAVGETVQLVATVTPANAANKNVSFSSSNQNVATVDDNGMVTAVGNGNAVITVTAEDGGVTATVTITVSIPGSSSPDDPTENTDDNKTETPSDTSGSGNTSGSDNTSGSGSGNGAAVSNSSKSSSSSKSTTTGQTVSSAEEVKKTVTKVTTNLDTVMEQKDAAKALETLTKDTTVEELSTAIQNDSKVLEKVEKLEEKFVEQNNITVKQSVSTGAAKVVDAEKIDVTGAGLNAKPGETVRLNIAIPTRQEKVNSTLYKNSVQVDIKLIADSGEIKNLKVPVTVTMPVPKGLSKEGLVVLHYKNDGTYEVLAPNVNADGTISFTVTHFSTFVFAQSTSVKAPKTGEQVPAALYIVFSLSLLGIVALRIKRKQI
jgi:hypothetical protein